MNESLYNQNYYPLDYRKTDVEEIISSLVSFRPVTIIGLPRVGLARILRFLLVHPKLLSNKLKSDKVLILEIDINDLFELNEKNFWQLVIKRIADNTDNKTIKNLYLSAAKTNDAFTFFDNTKQVITQLCSNGYAIFFLFNRFDRASSLFTFLFFGHLQSIKDVAKQKINFLFTSNQPLEYLSPAVFKGGNLEVFSQKYYLKPASFKDTLPVIKEFENSRKIKLNTKNKELIFYYSGGHSQYVLLILQTLEKLKPPLKNIDTLLKNDLSIFQQGKEIWDYLDNDEKSLIVTKKKIPSANFLSQIGLIDKGNIFNPLFEHFVKTQGAIENKSELTKKEKALLSILSAKKGELITREEIINFVWQDKAEEVNDWALDQLVKRLRKKMTQHKKLGQIITIKNQGYKITT